MADERTELKILGRIFGTNNGWDGDVDGMVFYEFEPGPNVTLPVGDLCMDFTNGTLEITSDNGEVTLFKGDLVTVAYHIAPNPLLTKELAGAINIKVD